MFMRDRFEAALKLRGKTIADTAAILHLNRSTLYKKMRQETDFSRAEVQMLKDALGLSNTETLDIFYA